MRTPNTTSLSRTGNPTVALSKEVNKTKDTTQIAKGNNFNNKVTFFLWLHFGIFLYFLIKLSHLSFLYSFFVQPYILFHIFISPIMFFQQFLRMIHNIIICFPSILLVRMTFPLNQIHPLRGAFIGKSTGDDHVHHPSCIICLQFWPPPSLGFPPYTFRIYQCWTWGISSKTLV